MAVGHGRTLSNSHMEDGVGQVSVGDEINIFDYCWSTDRFTRGITEPEYYGLSRPKAEQEKILSTLESNFASSFEPGTFNSMGTLKIFFGSIIDIFTDVASYLQPLDILQLSRSSRKFRDILTSKQSRPIWKAARMSLNLPKCPLDLSEAQYASLIFETDCNICGKPAHKIFYAMRLRLCRKCNSLNVIRGTKVAKIFGKDVKNDKVIYTLIPNFKDCRKQYDNCNRQYFYKPDLYDAIKSYTSLRSDTTADAFVEMLQDRKAMIITHSYELISWMKERRRKERMQIMLTQQEFSRKVRIKLTELGYTSQELFTVSDRHRYIWYRFLHQNRQFTPEAWNEVQPSLESILEYRMHALREREMRARHENHKFKISQFYDNYLAALQLSPEDYCYMPPVFTLFKNPAIEHLIRRDLGQQTITEDDWNAILPYFPQIINDHKELVAKQFMAKMMTFLKNQGGMKNVIPEYASELLTLTSTFFKCRVCQKDFPYPSILGHDHIRGIFPPTDPFFHIRHLTHEFAVYSPNNSIAPSNLL